MSQRLYATTTRRIKAMTLRHIALRKQRQDVHSRALQKNIGRKSHSLLMSLWQLAEDERPESHDKQTQIRIIVTKVQYHF